MSEQKDRFGLTKKRREELLAEIPTIGQTLKDATVTAADWGKTAFLRDIYKVAKAALSPYPLDEPVDFLTAMQAAADGYDLQYYIGATREPFVNYVKWKDFRFRILPKPAPTPKPKWISPEEAVVAFIQHRKSLRVKIGGEMGDGWIAWFDGKPVFRCRDGISGPLEGCTWNSLRDQQWCVVNPETGEAIETQTPD